MNTENLNDKNLRQAVQHAELKRTMPSPDINAKLIEQMQQELANAQRPKRGLMVALRITSQVAAAALVALMLATHIEWDAQQAQQTAKIDAKQSDTEQLEPLCNYCNKNINYEQLKEKIYENKSIIRRYIDGTYDSRLVRL